MRCISQVRSFHLLYVAKTDQFVPSIQVIPAEKEQKRRRGRRRIDQSTHEFTFLLVPTNRQLFPGVTARNGREKEEKRGEGRKHFDTQVTFHSEESEEGAEEAFFKSKRSESVRPVYRAKAEASSKSLVSVFH